MAIETGEFGLIKSGNGTDTKGSSYSWYIDIQISTRSRNVFLTPASSILTHILFGLLEWVDQKQMPQQQQSTIAHEIRMIETIRPQASRMPPYCPLQTTPHS